jgi:hypothetical protein
MLSAPRACGQKIIDRQMRVAKQGPTLGTKTSALLAPCAFSFCILKPRV